MPADYTPGDPIARRLEQRLVGESNRDCIARLAGMLRAAEIDNERLRAAPAPEAHGMDCCWDCFHGRRTHAPGDRLCACSPAPGYPRIADAIQNALDSSLIDFGGLTQDGHTAELWQLARCLDKAGLIDWAGVTEETPDA